jgi:drug/metabolite transporter (DMT)-like permease
METVTGGVASALLSGTRTGSALEDGPTQRGNGRILLHYIFLTLAVCAGAGAQILLKLRLTAHGQMPSAPRDLAGYVTKLAIDPVAILAVLMLVGAAVTWYFVVSRIPLSIAFAFAALSYPMILVGAHLFLDERVLPLQVMGNLLIVAGILLVATAGRSA